MGYINGFRGKFEKMLGLIRNQEAGGSTPPIGFFLKVKHKPDPFKPFI
jgi:hypothetical protein